MFVLVKKMYFPDPDGGEGTPAPEEKGNNKGGKGPEQPDNVALAKALEETRKNSVSKDEYNRVVEENKKLVSEIINGGGEGGSGQPDGTAKVDVEKLREELYGPKCKDLNNLQFWEKTLALREEIMKTEGYDPFLSHGANIKPNELEIERAQAVADVVAECIKESGGDSSVFTALLQSKTANDSASMTAHLKKLKLIK